MIGCEVQHQVESCKGYYCCAGDYFIVTVRLFEDKEFNDNETQFIILFRIAIIYPIMFPQQIK
jgi:hypothetical protein